MDTRVFGEEVLTNLRRAPVAGVHEKRDWSSGAHDLDQYADLFERAYQYIGEYY